MSDTNKKEPFMIPVLFEPSVYIAIRINDGETIGHVMTCSKCGGDPSFKFNKNEDDQSYISGYCPKCEPYNAYD